MILDKISETLQKGDPKQIAALIEQAFDAGMTPETVLNQGLIAGMDVVGQRFAEGRSEERRVGKEC